MASGFEERIRCESINISLPRDLINLISKVQRDRGDPNRSATFRFLLNIALGTLGYLPEKRRKAYLL